MKRPKYMLADVKQTGICKIGLPTLVIIFAKSLPTFHCLILQKRLELVSDIFFQIKGTFIILFKGTFNILIKGLLIFYLKGRLIF